MAERPQLGSIAEMNDGSEMILTSRGWIPNTERLENAAARSDLSIAGQSLFSSATLGLAPGPNQEESLISPLASSVGPTADIALMATGVGGIAKQLGKQGIKSGLRAGVRAGDDQIGPLFQSVSGQLGGEGTMSGRVAKYASAAADAAPGVGFGGLYRRAVNQKRTNMALARGMGFDDWAGAGRNIDDTLSDGIGKLKGRFKAFEESIPALPAEQQLAARSVMQISADNKLLGRGLTKVANEGGDISGQQMIQMRRELSEVMQDAGDWEIQKAAKEAIDEIDEIIESVLDGDALADYSDMRSRFKLWANARTGRGIGADGQVNARTLDGRFSQQSGFGDDYATGNWESLEKRLPQDVVQALKYTKEQARYESQLLQSSGTAERLQYTGLAALMGFGATR